MNTLTDATSIMIRSDTVATSYWPIRTSITLMTITDTTIARIFPMLEILTIAADLTYTCLTGSFAAAEAVSIIRIGAGWRITIIRIRIAIRFRNRVDIAVIMVTRY